MIHLCLFYLLLLPQLPLIRSTTWSTLPLSPRLPLELPPLYAPSELVVHVDFPPPNAIIRGTVLYVTWGLDVYNHTFLAGQHDRVGCMLVRDRNNAVVSYNDCQKDDTPKLMNLPPGKNMTLEVWTVDQTTSRVLSTTAIVPLTIVARDDDTLADNNTPAVDIQNQQISETTTAPRSWRDAAWTISFHRIVIQYLQQLHRTDQLFLAAMERDMGGNASRLQRLLFEPDLANQWENIIRAGMLGRSLPILALLPVKNVVWWRVGVGGQEEESIKNVTVLGNVRTLNEESWMQVAEGREQQENSGCGTLLNARSFPSMEAEEETVVLLLFGRSWSDLILLSKPKLAYNVVKRSQRGLLPVSVEIFVGISPEFDEASMKNLCQISGMPELQRMTTIDAGPLFADIHKANVIRETKLWLDVQ